MMVLRRRRYLCGQVDDLGGLEKTIEVDMARRRIGQSGGRLVDGGGAFVERGPRESGAEISWACSQEGRAVRLR